jgi:hypothetical protein
MMDEVVLRSPHRLGTVLGPFRKFEPGHVAGIQRSPYGDTTDWIDPERTPMYCRPALR